LTTHPRGSLSPTCDHGLTGSNPLPPSLLTAAERLDEVGRILAAGLLRLRRRESERRARDLEKKRLDFAPQRSVDGSPKTRRRRRV
jgi:hypothetical protein